MCMLTPLSRHCQHSLEFFPTSSIYRAHSRYSQASSAWDRLHAQPNNIRLLKFLVTHSGFPTRHQLTGFLFGRVIALTLTVSQHPLPRVLSLDVTCLSIVCSSFVVLVCNPSVLPSLRTSSKSHPSSTGVCSLFHKLANTCLVLKELVRAVRFCIPFSLPWRSTTRVWRPSDRRGESTSVPSFSVMVAYLRPPNCIYPAAHGISFLASFFSCRVRVIQLGQVHLLHLPHSPCWSVPYTPHCTEISSCL